MGGSLKVVKSFIHRVFWGSGQKLDWILFLQQVAIFLLKLRCRQNHIDFDPPTQHLVQTFLPDQYRRHPLQQRRNRVEAQFSRIQNKYRRFLLLFDKMMAGHQFQSFW